MASFPEDILFKCLGSVPLSNTGVDNAWSFTFTPIHFHGMVPHYVTDDFQWVGHPSKQGILSHL
jgi:hypothetical protein